MEKLEPQVSKTELSDTETASLLEKRNAGDTHMSVLCEVLCQVSASDAFVRLAFGHQERTLVSTLATAFHI